MARRKTELVTEYTESLLNLLISKDTAPDEYRLAMYYLGTELGRILAYRLSESAQKISLACTVEDADFLARGIIDRLSDSKKDLYVTVFWNKRFDAFENKALPLAPIIREFHDPGFDTADVLIVVKSIIASACVVKTNLTRLIEQTNPKQIFIAAPVLLKGATENLEQEFPAQINRLFEYFFFAEDTDSKDGMVEPGIGGEVYSRLGFSGQEGKNSFVPKLVKERRARATS